MRKHMALIGLAALLGAMPVYAQNRPESISVIRTAQLNLPTGSSLLVGKWTYRSYNNSVDLVGDDPAKALALIFGEGVFTFESAPDGTIKGTFDMGGGYVLDLKGALRPATPSSALTVEIAGYGRDGTPTAGWQYDYNASLGHVWPNATNQIPSLTGTVVRVKQHGNAKAGYVASFIAVKQP